MESLDMLYANKLRFLRVSKNLKQEVVSKALNLSQQAYSNLENGKTHFADEVIEGISRYFEMSPSDFLKPIEKISFSNSPHAYSNFNNTNEMSLIQDLVKSKDEAIQAKNEALAAKENVIKLLTAQIEKLEKK
jgi:transcriptional regulator with XRE-family HTH domain